MAAERKHECTSHKIIFCPEVKYILDIKRAEMKRTMASVNYSQVIEDMVCEWMLLKKNI